MFEQRFTERARKTVVRTQEKSYRLRHGYMETERLLAGLLRDEKVLAAQGSIPGAALDEAGGPRR